MLDTSKHAADMWEALQNAWKDFDENGTSSPDYRLDADNMERFAAALAMLTAQSPKPVHAADTIDAAMQAFDHMFEAIWPDSTPDAEERAAALQLTLNRYDEADDPDHWTIPADQHESITRDLHSLAQESTTTTSACNNNQNHI